MRDSLTSLWRGEMPLGEAFWIWAVTGGALVNIATSGLFLVLMMQDLPVLALVAGYALSIPYNILALVGVWRAADRHTGDRQWAETARIIAVVGLVILTVT